jgi:general secretion pathway protein A
MTVKAPSATRTFEEIAQPFLDFYRFQKIPFDRAIPTEHLFMTERHEEILARITYAIERQWFVVLTGACGSGKSTLIRRLMRTLDPFRYRCLYLADSKLTPRHFYNGILRQLGVEGAFYRGDSKRLLHREISLMVQSQKIQPVILIDEAHLLDREMLEELRFLLNFNVDSESPLALVLSGQPELNDKLNRQAFLAISQRVNMRCFSKNLDLMETKDYIRQQLTYAGSPSDIFSDDAVEEIFHLSVGSPRLINKVCTHALIYGTQREKGVLSASDIRFVIEQEI